MFGLITLNVVLAAALPFTTTGAVPKVVRAASPWRPSMYDRLSITERTIAALHAGHAEIRLPAVPQSLHYKTIRFVGNANSRAVDINNLGQILFTEQSDVSLPPYIADDNGMPHYLGDLLIAHREFAGRPTALSDRGGVAGEFIAKNGGVYSNNNLAWQLEGTVYDVLYYDGWDAGALAFGINNFDVSVGISGTTDPKHVHQASVFGPKYRRHALLPTHDSCGPAYYSYALGINDAGTIVGYEASCLGAVIAVRYSMFGYAKAIVPPHGGSLTVAEAVNEAGDIVGDGDDNAFLYRAACDCTSYLPRPAGETKGGAEGLALNSSDQVVGNIIDPADQFDAPFLYTDGRAYDLNALLPPNSGWTLNTAIALNDGGEIIGSGVYTDPSTGVRYDNVPFAMKP